MTHADILGERARLTPERIALVCVPGGKRFSYRELNDRAEACAARWRSLGLAKGERVGILAHNRVEYLDAFFAAAKSGVVLVPLSTRFTAHELAYIVQDAGCRALLHDSAFAEVACQLKSQASLEFLIDLDAGDSARRTYVCPRSGMGHLEVGPTSGEDPLCLLYTSGTTGKPKGVIIPHRMVAFNAYNTAASWQLRDTDVSPLFTPLYHAGGLAVSLTAMFLIGGRVVLHQCFDPSEVLCTIADEHCTILFGVPTIYKLLLDAPEFAATDLSSLRWCISGGAPLPLQLAEAWQRRGVIFKQGYGLTEVGVNCFAISSEDSRQRPGSVGKPMLFTEARLVVDGRDAAIDEAGELWLRGAHVSKGYWNNPEATAAALDAEGWFHTGDLARRDADGFFYIAGRLKDMIISGGVNIYPAEIEAELLQHPAVADAAVIGVPHETWGEVGVTFVVTRTVVSREELISFLASRLARYKLPREFIFVDELPRTAYGKVLKPVLRQRWEASAASASSSRPARGE